jgi:hypothetical protein
MRKLVVSLVTLTSLTACSQGDELSNRWSFELPDEGPNNDEEFARLGAQLALMEPERIVVSVSAVEDLAQPDFSPSGWGAGIINVAQMQLEDGKSASTDLPPSLAAQLEAEFEVVEETSTVELAGSPSADTSDPKQSSQPAMDLLLDELVELNFPQRSPRPDPLAQVQFSPSSGVSNGQSSGRFGATRPTFSSTLSAPVSPSAFATGQSDRVEINLQRDRRDPGLAEPTPPIDVSLNDDFGLNALTHRDANFHNGSEAIPHAPDPSSDEVSVAPVNAEGGDSDRPVSPADLIEASSPALALDDPLLVTPKRMRRATTLASLAQSLPKWAVQLKGK